VRSNDEGFTLTELLVASAVMITVTGGIFALLQPVHAIFKSQPEVSDMQQRMRVGIDVLMKDLVMAGSGVYAGRSAGPLLNQFAPVLPYRIGDTNADPPSGVFYRQNAISLLYVPSSPAQTTIREQLTVNTQDLLINAPPNCPPPTSDELCGFMARMRVLIFNDSGAWNAMTVTAVQNPMLHVRYGGQLDVAYKAGSTLTEVVVATYYLKTDIATNTFQLMRYDGAQTDLPVLDNVVTLELSYFGESQPPTLLPGKSLSDEAGPFTTYGPKPPGLDVDDPDDSWPAGENCIFMVEDGQQVPRLLALAAAGEVELRPDVLRDGPWCVDAVHVNRFDADLLRVRRVRVTLRVQAAAASMRGPAGVLFTRGGTAAGFVPDQEIAVDVTPRNLSLAR
jgi:hypothetical protein